MTRQTGRQAGEAGEAWHCPGGIVSHQFCNKMPVKLSCCDQGCHTIKKFTTPAGVIYRKKKRASPSQKKKDNELWVSFLPLCLFCSTYACFPTSSASFSSSALLHNELSMQKTLELSARFISPKETTLNFRLDSGQWPQKLHRLTRQL